MGFPIHRMRRLRRTENTRRMVRETRLDVDNLIMPLFVQHGESLKLPIGTMPGNYRMSVDVLVEECREIAELGIPGVILFGIPESKDAVGSEGYHDHGIIATAIRAVKQAVPDLLVWADVCMCEYTSHGHCGILNGEDVDNDATLPLLAKEAVVYAQAGADVIAPSDMMDGRVGAIRTALDEAGYNDRIIVSYAAKYASAYYGPFRDAADSAPAFGDRRSYQMDPANGSEALHEAALDIEEGADVVMVKPALAYLDIIWRVKQEFDMPVAAYNVSGEFSLIHAAAERDWVDLQRIAMETLLSIRRAGADIILTYFAKDAARWLRESRL
jgi:porphobilinogen synthase